MDSPQEDDDRTIVRPGALPARPSAAARVSDATMGGDGIDSYSTADLHTLPYGTRLGEFELHDLIGEGGFGTVYRAWDSSLERTVAVKEYMPRSMATRMPDHHVMARSERHRNTFDVGLRSFIKEAKLLAQFDHPALVKVYRFWEANGTAYMAMPFYQGPTLKEDLTAKAKPPEEAWLLDLLAPLTEALNVIHAEHCYHRDIAPDNIILLASNGKPLLLDFGAARRVVGNLNQQLTVILKPGYAPIEQYAEVPGMKQGPWTDVYALSAVVYWAITGNPPVPSVGRMVNDTLTPLAARSDQRYSRRFLSAIDRGLAVMPERRTQDINAFRHDLGLGALVPEGTVVSPGSDDSDKTIVRAPQPVSGPRPVRSQPGGERAAELRSESPASAEREARRAATAAEPSRIGSFHEETHDKRSSGYRRYAGMAAGALMIVVGWLWWILKEPNAGEASAPSIAAGAVDIASNPIVNRMPAATAVRETAADPPAPSSPVASVDTAATKPMPALPADRIPTQKPRQTELAKPSSRPQVAASSAECARILQSISLGDGNPKLVQRLNELGCR